MTIFMAGELAVLIYALLSTPGTLPDHIGIGCIGVLWSCFVLIGLYVVAGDLYRLVRRES